MIWSLLVGDVTDGLTKAIEMIHHVKSIAKPVNVIMLSVDITENQGLRYKSNNNEAMGTFL